jgi:hypothetical protein
MTKNEALRMGMDALVSVLANHKGAPVMPWNDALDEMKAALEAKDEPVAWISPTELLVMRGNALGGAKDWRVNVGLKPEDGDVGLYTTPPQRTWVGLTDEDDIDWEEGGNLKDLVKAIEAKLKEKNT